MDKFYKFYIHGWVRIPPEAVFFSLKNTCLGRVVLRWFVFLSCCVALPNFFLSILMMIKSWILRLHNYILPQWRREDLNKESASGLRLEASPLYYAIFCGSCAQTLMAKLQAFLTSGNESLVVRIVDCTNPHSKLRLSDKPLQSSFHRHYTCKPQSLNMQDKQQEFARFWHNLQDNVITIQISYVNNNEEIVVLISQASHGSTFCTWNHLMRTWSHVIYHSLVLPLIKLRTWGS